MNPRLENISLAQTWNNDILMEILVRIPAKPLIRFKLVSKHWLSLISCQQFSNLHSLRYPNSEPGLLLTTSSSKHHFFYFYPSKKLIPHHFPIFLTGSKILSSSNGLMLLQCDVDAQKDCLFVYNPTTRQSRKIPLLDDALVLSTNLAFDPSTSPHYKIVCVKEISKISVYERCCRIEIYDSATHAWKLCLESFTVSTHVFFPYGVSLKNAVYWGNCPHASLYYDIDKNEIRGLPEFQIPWPLPVGRVRGGAVYAQVQESNGRLCRPVKISGSDNSVAVFELEEDHSQWLLKHHDVVVDSPLLRGLDILCFIGEGRDMRGTLLFQFADKIMGYRFVDKSYEELVDFKNAILLVQEADANVFGKVPFGYSGVHHFCQSLAPV